MTQELNKTTISSEYLRISEIAKQDPKKVPELPIKNLLVKRIEVARLINSIELQQQAVEALDFIEREIKNYFLFR